MSIHKNAFTVVNKYLFRGLNVNMYIQITSKGGYEGEDRIGYFPGRAGSMDKI
jgi:hypothetical protein